MLITFAGLPSAGKSSTARALGMLLNAPVFVEPEESEWPSLIRDREITGRFTALTWFRGARLPGLFAAHEINTKGGTAIVDSYYDKLIALYIEKQCFNWLISKTDPYFQTALQMAKTDYSSLPNADVLIFLKLNEETWIRFMKKRGRVFDQQSELANHFEMQEHFERACEIAASEHGMRLCVMEQIWSSANDTAKRIKQVLKEY